MTQPFAAQMPDHPPHQKHAKPKRSDNYNFLASLRGDQAADVNLQWKWNDPTNPTQSAGGAAFGMHWPDPARNGYTRITIAASGHVLTRKMKPHDLHRQVWAARDVRRWRRGRTRLSPRPRTYAELVRYAKRHGGTVVGELKSQAFGAYPFIMRQLVATARLHDHAPWFKSLVNMKFAQEKCANTVGAGGQFAIIFGSGVRGRAARIAKGKAATAGWSVPPTRIW